MFFFIHNDIRPQEEPGDPRGISFQSKKRTSCGYLGMMMIDPEEIKFVVIVEASCWEPVPQSSGSCEECARVKHTFDKWNMKGLMSVQYTDHDVASLSWEGSYWWNEGM